MDFTGADRPAASGAVLRRAGDGLQKDFHASILGPSPHLLSSSCSQVLCGSNHPAFVVPEESERYVAEVAKQATNLPGLVIVVHDEAPLPFLPTDSAHSALALQKAVVLSICEMRALVARLLRLILLQQRGEILQPSVDRPLSGRH